jgi:hypothetical protein
LEPKWGDKDEYGHYWRGSDGTWIWKYLDTYRVYPSPRGLVVVEDVDGGEVWFMPRRPLGGALKFEGLPQRLLPKCIKDWLGVRG